MILNDIHITRFLKNQGRLSRVRNCLTTALLLTWILVLLLASCAGRAEGKATQEGCELLALISQQSLNQDYDRNWDVTSEPQVWETFEPQANGAYCRFSSKVTYSAEVPADRRICEGWVARLEEGSVPVWPQVIIWPSPFFDGLVAGCKFRFIENICGDLSLLDELDMTQLSEDELDPTLLDKYSTLKALFCY